MQQNTTTNFKSLLTKNMYNPPIRGPKRKVISINVFGYEQGLPITSQALPAPTDQ